MDTIGRMSSFRDDAINSARPNRSDGVRRADDKVFATDNFDLLLASNLAMPAVQPGVESPANAQPSPQTPTAQAVNNDTPKSQATSSPAMQVAEVPDSTTGTSSTAASGQAQPSAAGPDGATAAAVLMKNAIPQEGGNASAAPTQGTSPEGGNGVEAGTNVPSALVTTPQDQGDATTIMGKLANLDLVSLDAENSGGTLAPPQSPPAKTSTATTTQAQGNLMQSAESAETSDVVSATPTSNTPQSSVTGTNDPGAALAAAHSAKSKAKSVEGADLIKVAQTPTTANTALTDASGLTMTSGLQDAGLTAGDQAKSAPQLTPHTIPMLAATMMRRFESGARQFIMRLDPPELGQVEVKLTVAADKKVRAVVSAERPEALADLVRSARELTRALLEAGLDLEDNGLTFTLNDQSGNNQSGSKRQHAHDEGTKSNLPLADKPGDNEARPMLRQDTIDTSNDPFQRWQRARLAMTA